MSDSFPRVTLFIPGRARTEAEWTAALEREGLQLSAGELTGDGLDFRIEAEWIENDGQFGAAFSFGTVETADVAIIDDAPSALVLHVHEDLLRGRLSICSALRGFERAGALAVRLEQSKVGWTIGRWISLMCEEDPWAWHHAAVSFLSDDGHLQSCGMHAFSLPDVRAATLPDEPETSRFMTALNSYQLAEDPLLVSGHTFSPDADTPRRSLERWPDATYVGGHPCNNPYGVWRLGSPASVGNPPPELAAAFIPSLSAVLHALERQSATPLTSDQVLAARDRAACMAMEHRDLQKLERSRGYADLDPELAWEQWQLVRRSHAARES